MSGFAFLSRKEFRAAFRDLYGSPEETPVPGDLLATSSRLAREMHRERTVVPEARNAERPATGREIGTRRDRCL